MSKFTKLIKALQSILRQPSLLNKVLADEDVNKQQVIKKYALDKGLPCINIRELLPGFEDTIEPYSFLDGTSLPTDIYLLKGLAKKFPDCCYLEIGTWRGESVSNVSTVAKECYTVNLPDDEMRKMGLSEKYISLHCFFSKHIPNVTHVRANSFDFDFNSLKKKFDLVFIDGYHHYNNVLNDTLKTFPLLKDKDSVMVWHDYGSTTEDIRWEVLLGILDAMPASERKYVYRVSNTLCAIYTRQQLKAVLPEIPSEPDKYFSIQIKTHPLP